MTLDSKLRVDSKYRCGGVMAVGGLSSGMTHTGQKCLINQDYISLKTYKKLERSVQNGSR